MRRLSLIVLLWACTNERPEETGFEETGTDDSCSPALSLTSNYPAVLPLHQMNLTAAGGTGEYRFTLENNSSEAIVNTLSGAYLASEVINSTDVIIVTDLGCEGSASLTVVTLDAFTASPDSLSVLPGTEFTPEISGGSAEFLCELILGSSGATLTDCDYIAGGSNANDLLRITDIQTGHIIDISISVDAAAGLGDLVTEILLPVGSEYSPNANGGSGVFDYTVLSGAADVSDGVITTHTAGTSSIHIADRYAGFESTLTITAVEAESPTILPDGEMTQYAEVISAGDLNNDGFDDAIMGVYSASYHQHYGGLVSVYSGSADPSTTSPAQNIGGTEYKTKFGYGLGLGDFNGDGQSDLAIGIHDGPLDNQYAGYVEIYSGIADGFFEEEPSITLDADYGVDRLGQGMDSCDLNNDGYDDLIVGARNAEDRTQSPIQYSQGGLYIYYGSPTGLASRADDYRWGPTSSYYLGTTVVTGDFNGDGHCDVIGGTEYYTSETPETEGAAVLFYNDTLGELDSTPAIYFEGTGKFSFRMDVGDLDDDGLDDVAFGAWTANNPEGLTKTGAVAVFMGASLQGESAGATARMEDADWLFYGDTKSKYFGREVAIGDGDGDGVDDLTIGATAGEPASGSPTNAGVVYLYLGGSSTQPSAEVQEWSITESYSYFGAGLGYIGHFDDDAIPDWFVYSDRLSTHGPDCGSPLLISTAYEIPITLEYAQKSAGHGFGRHRSMTLFHANDDAYIDLIFSGHDAGSESNNYGILGRLFALYGTETGFEDTSTEVTLYDREWSSGSRKGYRVISAPFSQIGEDDLVILSRDESKPTNLNTTDYANPTECAGNVSGSGMISIYDSNEGGLDTYPDFVYFSDYTYDDLRSVIGNLDVNGDGRPDIVVGSELWKSSQGGLAVLIGKDVSTPGKTEVICTADEVIGASINDQFAFSLAALGDLNGDGCDDFASGAPFDNTQGGDGTVTIIWGWDSESTPGSLCPDAAQITTLASKGDDQNFGTTLESIDIDGDGLQELLIGLPDAISGGVFNLNGADLAALTSGALDNGAIPEYYMGHSYWVEDLPLTTRLDDGPGFGVAISAITHPNETGAFIAIGSDQDAGKVILYEFTSSNPSGDIVALVNGETHRPGGQLGAGLHLQAVGSNLYLIVGAPEHDAPDGVDQGGVYPFIFPLPSL